MELCQVTLVWPVAHPVCDPRVTWCRSFNSYSDSYVPHPTCPCEGTPLECKPLCNQEDKQLPCCRAGRPGTTHSTGVENSVVKNLAGIYSKCLLRRDFHCSGGELFSLFFPLFLCSRDFHLLKNLFCGLKVHGETLSFY